MPMLMAIMGSPKINAMEEKHAEGVRLGSIYRLSTFLTVSSVLDSYKYKQIKRPRVEGGILL